MSGSHAEAARPQEALPGRLSLALARVLILLVRVWQMALSPFLGASCRFHPSCSAYAVEALQRHGAWRGSCLTTRRLSRCHPFHEGGLDPVP